MKILFCVVLALQLVVPSQGQVKKVCFSIDDLPVVAYGLTDSSYLQAVTTQLVGSLRRNNVPAIGFVNETKLYRGDVFIPFQVRLLQQWVDGGLDLGNHTFSHPDFNTHSFGDYSMDILKGEIRTREILSRKNKSLKYFRHPFLHVGASKAKADSLDRFLTEHHYTVAPVTIDNEDYVFALAYQRSVNKKDKTQQKQIAADYINYMERKVLYFEKQARVLFNRDMNQILLIHANALNADCMDDLVAMFQRNQYVFITMEEALTDSAYSTPVTVFGSWGISWIDRWALSQGKKGDFFKEEPSTPGYIKELAKWNRL